MTFGNDSKVGLATLVPLLLLIAAGGLFIAAMVVHHGDVEKATTWATAVAVGFFGLLTTLVRLAQAPRGGSTAAASMEPAVVPPDAVPDPLDRPVVDEPPAAPTDAKPA